MRVELLVHWNGFRPGHVFTLMSDGVANLLISRKVAKDVGSISQQADSSNRADNRAADESASSEAVRTEPDGHLTRRPPQRTDPGGKGTVGKRH